MDKLDRLVSKIISGIHDADKQTEQCAGVFFRCLRDRLEEFLREENQEAAELEEMFAEVRKEGEGNG